MDVKDIIDIMDIAAIADADFDDLDSIRAARAMQKRHLQMAQRLEELAIRGMEEMQRKVAAGQPLNLTAEECKTLFNLSRKLAPSLVMGEEMLKLLDPSGGKKPN